jgi:hypothetical protein
LHIHARSSRTDLFLDWHFSATSAAAIGAGGATRTIHVRFCELSQLGRQRFSAVDRSRRSMTAVHDFSKTPIGNGLKNE